MSLIIEIRAGEGGADSKDLVNVRFGFYSKYAKRNNIKLDVLTIMPGLIIARATGKKVSSLFKNESGIIRWQRIPPSEKKGRVHTSTITVAIMPELKNIKTSSIRKEDVEIKTARGSGAGGQHRNVTDSAVQIKHLPTGIIVKCENGRSQHQNKESAMRVLESRLLDISRKKILSVRKKERREKVGLGGRGEEKIRTIREQDGKVENHTGGKSITFKAYSRGRLEDLNI
jgi:peptide chain release factor 1